MARPIFLAAPELGQAATGLLDKILVELQIATGGALSPSLIWNAHVQVGDAGIDVKPEEYFAHTLTALSEARVVVAVIDGAQVDEQVAFLAGYAFAAGKPIIAYHTDNRAKSVLLEGAAAERATDPRQLASLLRRHL